MNNLTTPSVTEWLTAAEAAKHLKVRPRTLLLWAREGKIRGYQLSGVVRHVWRFRQSDLDDAMLSVSSADSADKGAA